MEHKRYPAKASIPICSKLRGNLLIPFWCWVTARSREGDVTHRRKSVTSTESQDLYEGAYLAGRKENMKFVGRASSREIKSSRQLFCRLK
jgi:hypothetical protein